MKLLCDVARTGSESVKLRVGLFGRLGSGNIGNDASLEAMLAYLTREIPDAELGCRCSGAVELTRRYDLPKTPCTGCTRIARPLTMATRGPDGLTGCLGCADSSMLSPTSRSGGDRHVLRAHRRIG